jgi:hypothetical protein
MKIAQNKKITMKEGKKDNEEKMTRNKKKKQEALHSKRNIGQNVLHL